MSMNSVCVVFNAKYIYINTCYSDCEGKINKPIENNTNNNVSRKWIWERGDSTHKCTYCIEIYFH